MKSWEKVMFYLLFPFAMFWHGLKKSAKYMERKSKPAIAMLVAVTMIMSIMPMQSFALASSVEISTLSDLQSFKSRIESGEGSLDAVLTASIDMSSVTDWNGIGTQENPYTGTFDGQGYSIANLSGTHGLFVENGGTIKNVYMKNVNVNGSVNIGAIVGKNLSSGVVQNCIADGIVNGTGPSIGGLVGWNNGGTMTGCVYLGTIGNSYGGGGLVGSNYGNGSMTACLTSYSKMENDTSYGAKSDVFYKPDTSYRNHSGTTFSVSEASKKINDYWTANDGPFALQLVDSTVDGNELKLITEDFIINGGTEGTDYTYDSGILTVNSGYIKVKNRDTNVFTTDTIVLNGGKLELAGVNISTSVSPIEIGTTSDVTISLSGTNKVISTGSAGIHKTSGSNTLYITSASGDGSEEGSLDVASQTYASGIGGKSGEKASNIVINGGTITAGSWFATGIGGGNYAGAENIQINGGFVTVSGTSGIGGSRNSETKNITIAGGRGIVTSGNSKAYPIGSGIDYGRTSNSYLNPHGGSVIYVRTTDSANFSKITSVTDINNYNTTTKYFEFYTKTPHMADMFDYKAPENLLYDGNGKTATVTVKDGVTSVGSYSVVYCDKDGKQVDTSDGLPVDAGTYTVKINIEESDMYAAVNGLTNTDWTFKIEKDTPGVIAPTAKENLVYSGAERELINAGSATGGTIQYALGTAEAVTGEWGTDIPKATKAGTYYVWYKVVGSDNYNDVEPACITVKIEKAMLTVVQSLTEIDWYPGMSIDYDASALKNLFAVTDANGKNFTFKINAVYNSSNQPIEEIVDAGVYTIELQPFYNSLVGNYSFGTKPLTLTVKPLDLTGQSVTRDTSLDPTYTGETALPLATSSGKLNFDIGKVYDILTKKERSRTLWANDGYWKFEVIEGKNSTDAGDAYISIVGLGGNVIGSCEFKYTIKQQKMAAPEGLVAVDETISKKKDGKISGLTTAMEYNTSKYGTYDPVTDVDMLFEADTYYVRTAAPNSNYKPSDPVEIIIGEGRKLTVTIPTAEEQIGYTLTVNTNEINWHGRVAITFKLADGYSKSITDFAVKVNGTAVTLDDYGKYILTDAETDVEITVEGVVDETAPDAEISITTNKWTSFLKDITFGLFFKETQDITITAIDKGSGEDKIYYYISEDILTEDEVKALTADKWTLYDADNKPSIDPDKKCVVYVKATDKAQNVKFISSTGLVFDGTAPVISGIENGGIYYGDKIFKALDDNFLKIEVDGIDITDTTEGDDEYKIVADNAEHTVTVTDKAGNITEYKITVYKQYTVTFVVDGEVFDTKTVNHKADAEMPEIPAKEGYDQTAPTWDKEGKEITEDTTITAVYTINKYTVTYKADGDEVATVTVEHGKDATAPTIPTKDGHTQTAPTWDKDGKNITADTEINAVYTINKYTVTYKADGEVVDTVTVEHGENATSPSIPKKDGYVGKWDLDGKNITEDTAINAVYTAIPVVNLGEVKPNDKTELEDSKKQLEDMLDDDDYTEDEKKDIQEAINGIDDALKVIENVEAVEELIDNLPEKITKNDEDAIKAANDAYNALTDYEKSLVDEDAKNALDDAKVALAELNKPADTTSPNTGENSNLWLWFALLFISGGALITLTVVDRKRRTANK